MYNPATGNTVLVVVRVVGRKDGPGQCPDVVAAVGIDFCSHFGNIYIIRSGWNHFGRVI